MSTLSNIDPQIAGLIDQETQRQREGLELIASENYVSEAVMQAMGSVLTNKYSEGYPGKRYYGGNQIIDQIESLAIERAKTLFGAEHANVQPHAGAQANFAVYLALCNAGDTVLAMDLAHGGHLTHGSPVNFSGKLYNIVPYGVRPSDHLVDMDQVRALALERKPRMILAGFSAYPRKLDFQAFAEIAKEVGAYLLVDMAHVAGLVAAKLYPDPVPHADVVTTTTHKTLRGPRGAMILCKTEDRLDPEGKKNLAQKIDSGVFPGSQGGPLEHIIAAKAVAFSEALRPSYKTYIKNVVKNMKVFADTMLSYDFDLVTGGTDNHLILVDLRSKELTGKEFEAALSLAGITVNKNSIPSDPNPPKVTSGIRVGTAALTTRGMKAREMKIIAGYFNQVANNINNEKVLWKIKKEVEIMTKNFPVPGIS